jgi:hypothetical protein
VVDETIRAAVREGLIWLTSGPASLLGEDVSPALVSPDAVLQAPPDPISPLDVLPTSLTDAWKGSSTDALALAVGLSKKAGKTLPWVVVRDAIDAAFRARLLERTPGGGDWPCEFSRASTVTVRVPAGAGVGSPTPAGVAAHDATTRTSQTAALKTNQLQDLVDVLPDVLKATTGLELTFRLSVELKSGSRPSEKVVTAVNKLVGSIDDALRVQ